MDTKKIKYQLSKWSVLILSTGYGEETVRSLAENHVKNLGFLPSIYDGENYPADRMSYSHEACLKEIKRNDAILAFISDKQGGIFQRDKCSETTIHWLIDNDVLDANPDTNYKPSIIHVEILTAQKLGKPIVILVDEQVQQKVDQQIKLLKEGSFKILPNKGSKNPPDYKELIESSNWKELLRYYKIGSGLIESPTHLFFIDTLRKSNTNYFQFFSKRHSKTLEGQISNGLRAVGDYYLRNFQGSLVRKIETERPPVGNYSLNDLKNKGLLLDPPIKIESGSFPKNPIFFPISGKNESDLVKELKNGRNILILGDPGMGKTTVSLITYFELYQKPVRVISGPNVLFISLKDVYSEVKSTDELIRNLIGRANGKKSWPISLPTEKIIIVLDGIDESQLPSKELSNFLKIVSNDSVSILCTCRSATFFQKVERLKEEFNLIIQFETWKTDNLYKYALTLENCGFKEVSSYIKERVESEDAKHFLSIPLWLNMITFMIQRSINYGKEIKKAQFKSDYQFIDSCMKEVAIDELIRKGEKEESVTHLLESATEVSWLIHKSRRKKEPLLIEKVIKHTKLNDQSAIFQALLEMLRYDDISIDGFRHEVFLEYWLSRYIYVFIDSFESIDEDENNFKKLFEILGFQRPPLVNQMFRDAVSEHGIGRRVSAIFREAYFHINEDEKRYLFIKNQLVYFIGRIGKQNESIAFLKQIYNDTSTPTIVKNSAAFGLIWNMDIETEKHFFSALQSDSESDESNIAYHLYYYGDTDYNESEMPPTNDRNTNAKSTINRLKKRIAESSKSSCLLRRIELLTLIRIIETREVETEKLSNEDLKQIYNGIKISKNIFADSKFFCDSLDYLFTKLAVFS